MNISNRLTALAADINATLDRHDRNRAEWVDIKLDLCRQLAEARAQFPDDQGFGHWFTDTIGSAISKDDRAAYIAMGEHLDVARDVLEKTERSSIRHIHINEFAPRFRHAAKPRREYKKTVSPEAGRDLASAYLDEGKTLEQVTEEADLASVQHVKIAVAREEGRRAALAEADLMATPLSISSQKVLDARVRQLEKEFDQRVYTAALARHDEWVKDKLSRWNDRIARIEKLLAARGGVLKAAEYRTIMQCVHPDTGANVSTERRNDAVRILTENRLKLMGEKEDPQRDKHGMPRTVDELLARKAAVKAERAAMRAKKTA